ncbi:DegV family protein with EDD domain [Tumebacillus sp. BK434]|uniref:DegV family protein n=1 Tax=Tumebacillus sp. BK434 TaxID=2512169 RepID=UPI0010534075|nr:DegV family protein [Tumebacillus sp. BK434]TCP57827.1 DegV family protein with EDD domain [Tumebacillus sp. BK434]
MSKIAIVTDSTAYLPTDTIHKYGITVVSLMVNFGQESHKEGVDITSDQFFARLAVEKNLPTTSQPSVGEMVQAYERLLETHDSIIGIFLSSKLSGTAHSAETASRMVEGDITVIDSKITAFGQARLVLTACEMIEAGQDKETIVAKLNEMVETIKAYFIVDSLEHLHRGGRVSGAAALIGSLLQVKPILHVEDGKLELLEKVRTRKKSLARIAELIKAKQIAGKKLTMAIVYTDNASDAAEVAAQFQEQFPEADISTAQIGPVIGTHVGPGLLGFIFDQQ